MIKNGNSSLHSNTNFQGMHILRIPQILFYLWDYRILRVIIHAERRLRLNFYGLPIDIHENSKF